VLEAEEHDSKMGTGRTRSSTLHSEFWLHRYSKNVRLTGNKNGGLLPEFDKWKIRDLKTRTVMVQGHRCGGKSDVDPKEGGINRGAG